MPNLLSFNQFVVLFQIVFLKFSQHAELNSNKKQATDEDIMMADPARVHPMCWAQQQRKKMTSEGPIFIAADARVR